MSDVASLTEGLRNPRETELAIVVPVYRNATTLEELSRRIGKALNGVVHDYRLLFVVDASPDDSWSVVQLLAARDEHVCGMLLEKNLGQHQALLRGLSLLRAEFYAVLDADLQDPPEYLREMYRKAYSAQETVFGLRQGIYQSWLRMATSRIQKRLLGCWTGLPARAGTYLLIPRGTVESMLEVTIEHPQVVIMAYYCSASWSVLRFNRMKRPQGGSSYSEWGRLKAAWQALGCARECRARLSDKRDSGDAGFGKPM